MRVMRAALITIGIIQILFGATLLVRPATLQTSLHLQPAAPAWVNYILAMSAARIIGYGIGMFVAARAPWRHRVWINTMIAIQAVDFIATAAYLANGVLPLGHVAAGLVLPWLWIAVLGRACWWGTHRTPADIATGVIEPNQAPLMRAAKQIVRARTVFSWRFVTPLLAGSALNPINSSLIATALVPIAAALHVPVGRTAGR